MSIDGNIPMAMAMADSAPYTGIDNFGGSNSSGYLNCNEKNYLDCVRARIFGRNHFNKIQKSSPFANSSRFRNKRLSTMLNNKFENQDFSLNAGRGVNFDDYYLVKKSFINDLNGYLNRIKRFSDSQSKLIRLLTTQTGQNNQQLVNLNKQFQQLYKDDAEIHKSYDWVANEIKNIASSGLKGHRHDTNMDVSSLSNEELAGLLGVDVSVFRRKNSTNVTTNNGNSVKKIKNQLTFTKTTSNNINSTNNIGVTTGNTGNLTLEEKLKKLKQNSRLAQDRLNQRRQGQSSPVLLDNSGSSNQNSINFNISSSTNNSSNSQNFPSSNVEQTQRITRSVSQNTSGLNGNNNSSDIDANTFNSGFGLNMNQDFNNLDLNNFINSSSSSDGSGNDQIQNMEIVIKQANANSSLQDDTNSTLNNLIKNLGQ
jgi:hypothetical protein